LSFHEALHYVDLTKAQLAEGATRMTRKEALRRYGPWVALVVAAAAYYRRFAKDWVGMTLYPQAGK